jgi:hypothetical protein
VLQGGSVLIGSDPGHQGIVYNAELIWLRIIKAMPPNIFIFLVVMTVGDDFPQSFHQSFVVGYGNTTWLKRVVGAVAEGFSAAVFAAA